MIYFKDRHWLYRFFVTLMLLALSNIGHAAPVGFKGSVMTMGEWSSDWRELQAMYSFTAQDAIAAGYTEVQSQGTQVQPDTKRWQMSDVHYNRLVQRWNLPNAQVNMYALLGVSAANSNTFTGTTAVWQPGMQFDIETRRLYFAAKAHGYYGGEVRASRADIAAGFSFYLTEYDEVQPWFVLEASKKFGTFAGEGKTEITPYLRLIHKRLFVEVGPTLNKPNASASERWKLNFRYTF